MTPPWSSVCRSLPCPLLEPHTSHRSASAPSLITPCPLSASLPWQSYITGPVASSACPSAWSRSLVLPRSAAEVPRCAADWSFERRSAAPCWCFLWPSSKAGFTAPAPWYQMWVRPARLCRAKHVIAVCVFERQRESVCHYLRLKTIQCYFILKLATHIFICWQLIRMKAWWFTIWKWS